MYGKKRPTQSELMEDKSNPWYYKHLSQTRQKVGQTQKVRKIVAWNKGGHHYP